MNVVFVTDRADAHVQRFHSLFSTLTHSYSHITVTYDTAGEPVMSLDGSRFEGWEAIRLAVEAMSSLVISGPLDTVSAGLAGGSYRHIGISWATDVMVTAAASGDSWESMSSTVRSLDLVVTDNYPTENACIAMGVPPEHILRIPWGPAPDLGGPTGGREDFDLPEARSLILYPRSLEPHYQPDVFVEALAIVARAHPEALAVLVETGSLVDEVRAQVARLGLEDSLSWQPSRSAKQFQELLALADVLVVSPKTDGTSVTVMDAMSMGVPVVSSLTSGSAEWIMDGITGWSFPVGDSDALATAILSALNCDPQRRRKITDAAANLVAVRGGWEASSRRFCRAIEELIDSLEA
ncbi:glycosyltransferase family 4 protein [Pontimonas sp.]|nr:glycosyltransferase family 4 protein [Pontimonas sp.]